MLALALVFVSLAGYRLDAPGLYADEMLFAPAAFEALGQCAIDAQVSKHVGECFPLYLNPPYLGTLKAWLYAPLVWAFEPTPALMRWPMVVLAALTIVGWAQLVRTRFGVPSATACLLLLALDPAYAIHARLDWGPVIIGGVCKLGMLAALWRWLERGSTTSLATLGAFAVIGLYDKLSFAWVIAAFGGAALMLHLPTIVAQVRARRWRYWAVFAAACAVPALLFKGAIEDANALRLPGADTPFEFAARWQSVRALVDTALAGDFVKPWIAGVHGIPASWPMKLLAAELLALCLVLALRPWRIPELRARAQAVLFISAAIVLLLLALIATRQVGGAHHTIVLWPLPWINAILIVDLLARRLVRADQLTTALPLTLAVAVACATPPLVARHQELREVWRGEHGFAGRFSPESTTLSAALAGRDAHRVISTDWGLHQPLLVLSHASERARLLDWWSVFNDSPASFADRNAYLREHHLQALPLLMVSFAPGRAVMPATQEHLPAHLAAWRLCVASVETILDAQKQPLYEIRSVTSECDASAEHP